MKKYDFSGWATRNRIKCSDGRIIEQNAFKHNDGQKVPLVWNHKHDDPYNILGHAMLKNCPEGVYAYCTLNSTEQGENARELIKHGDICSLSIFANRLKQKGSSVLHGEIKEVSLVLAGANPGAFIDSVLTHGEASESEATIYTGEEISLAHSEETDNYLEEEETLGHADKGYNSQPKSESEETIADVFDTLSEKQKTVVYALIGTALEEADEEEDDVKHNLFDSEGYDGKHLSHADIDAVFSDAKRRGSLKDSVIEHGIENLDYLFPDEKSLDNPPQLINRDLGWVAKVMSSVHHTPFSRIKSTFADLTADDARAKGYLKGNFKAEEVFSLLKRSTTPTTIYKKQKIDRDDVVDITDFDVVAWLKSEMRMMLDEEIARAILVGDGRLNSSDDKIDETHIRPIWKDEALFTIKKEVTFASGATSDIKAKTFIREAIKARKDYKGSGEPTLYTTEDVLTDCLLIEDSTGRVIYDSISKLATALRVKEIIPVPVLENQTRTDGGDTFTLMGIIVNLTDYNVGADKGGAVNIFDDFDIDYNAQKYLIETRASGALIKPFSAIVLEYKVVTSG